MDRHIVVRSQQGDEAAFRELTLAVGPRLLDVAFGILRERTSAEDAAQRALLQIWRTLPGLRHPDRFDAWSYRVLVHACYAEARHRPRWLPESAILATREPHAPDDIGVVADRDELERGFGRLSVDHRAVIVLHYLMELTLDQTADALDIPVGTVRSRLHYAMRGLRAAIDGDRRPTPRLPAISQEVTR